MDTKTFLCGAGRSAFLAIASPASYADITVFNTEATFLAAVSAPGVDTFTGFSTTDVTNSPITRCRGPYAYSASSASGFFGAGTVGQSGVVDQYRHRRDHLLQLCSGASAIGGTFFGSDLQGSFVASAVVLTATDRSARAPSRTFVAAPTSFSRLRLDRGDRHARLQTPRCPAASSSPPSTT
jgi:hypothetical protein